LGDRFVYMMKVRKGYLKQKPENNGLGYYLYKKTRRLKKGARGGSWRTSNSKNFEPFTIAITFENLSEQNAFYALFNNRSVNSILELYCIDHKKIRDAVGRDDNYDGKLQMKLYEEIAENIKQV